MSYRICLCPISGTMPKVSKGRFRNRLVPTLRPMNRRSAAGSVGFLLGPCMRQAACNRSRCALTSL